MGFDADFMVIQLDLMELQMTIRSDLIWFNGMASQLYVYNI